MFLRVTTKPPLDRRRRAGHDFTRAPVVVELDDIAAKTVREDDGLVSREVTAAEAAAWRERVAAARAAEDAAKANGADDDFGVDADDGKGGVAAQQLRREADRRQAAELEVSRLRKLLADNGIDDPHGEENARQRGAAGDASTDASDEEDEGDVDASPIPNDGGPQRLRPQGRKRRG